MEKNIKHLLHKLDNAIHSIISHIPRMKKKMSTSAAKEVGKHPCKKVMTESLENQQQNE